MGSFIKGSILRGNHRDFNEAYHPVIYMRGLAEAPSGVVLTRTATEEIPCNFKLTRVYDKRPQYFVAHLIQKMAEWGPYSKEGELSAEDLKLIESTISSTCSITWIEYLNYTENGCPDHKKI